MWTPMKLKLIFLGQQNYFIARFFCNNIIICIRILVLHHVRVWLVVSTPWDWDTGPMAHRFIYGAQTCVHFAVLIGTWQAAISSLLLVCPHQNNYTHVQQSISCCVGQSVKAVQWCVQGMHFYLFGCPAFLVILWPNNVVSYSVEYSLLVHSTQLAVVVSMATHPQPILLTIFVYQGMQITCQPATVDGASLYPTPTQLQDNLNATMQFH